MKKFKTKKLNCAKLTLEWLRERGWVAEMAEYRIPYSFITKDLFGFLDIMACHPDGRCIGVQATSRGNLSSRRKKIAAHENFPTVYSCIQIFLSGWQLEAGEPGVQWHLMQEDGSMREEKP